MSEPANTSQIVIVDASENVGTKAVCRDERCELLGVHVAGPCCVRGRKRENIYRTRSRRHAEQPWRANHYEALHESVFNAVSAVEPRNFSTILSFVENDYGSCCERSVHRHLSAWREEGGIVRMDFRGRIHAYLRAGSRLIRDPDLVLEQIIDLHTGYEGIPDNRTDDHCVKTAQTYSSTYRDIDPTDEEPEIAYVS